MLRLQVCLLLSGICAQAAAPALDCLYPLAVPRGSTDAVTAVGKFDPWPPKMWTSARGVTFTAETNKGKFQVAVAADVKAGPYFVRAFNDEGASAPRFLWIADSPESHEKEPNNDFERAHPIERFPAVVNGRFDKNDDVDAYRIDLAKGQRVVVRIEAYLLASPVDAVLRLLDARGVEVAFNHDDGRTLDPEIAFTAPQAGRYLLQTFGFNYPADSNIRFVGNDKCVYRLHVETGRAEEPLGGCVRETEPNNTASNAMPVEVPCAIGGCIQSSDDEDIFEFPAKKGEKFSLKVEAAVLGFPVDARLAIRNSKQEEVAKADDSSTADPALDWSPDNDGTFFAAVRNVVNRGGSNFLYRFSIQKPEPALKATVGEHAFRIEAGATNKIKVSVQRLHGFDEKLFFIVEELPEGLRYESEESGVSLIAASEAKAFSGPIRIVAKGSKDVHPVVHELTTLGEDNGVPNGYSRLLINSIDQLWLTVAIPSKK